MSADGVFFVALEANGHVYAFVLNKDETATLISEIDPGMGTAMALDYDSYDDILWVKTDDTVKNMYAQIKLNGTATPDITYIKAPAGFDTSRNAEGFTIADPEYTVNGLRPVFHITDGVTSGALNISYLNCAYEASTTDDADSTDKVTGNDETKSGAPKTGDESNMIWPILMLASSGALSSLAVAKKRQSKQHK